ncbi:MAG: selenocysteine-specific translation factor [Anaerolineaceae bacterium]|nr:selenocysteine-specific translation elongation factor [Anaerolineae bacterium]MDL1925035.1 selenocysteine-specific translation elongation factor [Anaerolineae bacterium AMX1]WKZ53452.1 MAG: selenocysteine-specific translation elongation factor [Anaerolineales bacterium]GIK09920.1 MAG: selenocysteine-specific translation factor [Chloroflexota bacterium]GJQ38977.1 MAG: selenocysteine-specific translation factor [Anaerolineaceae bacterium]
MRVIGTAGHVDHGKSTLIAALTGVHPDRLKEEREREMTIDLGFGWLVLPNGEEIGIVDVPGHRDFIENMLAGIGGIDAALLVIAADEGVMPQTREHLAILDLLQIPAGLIALTKTDLAPDPDWLELLEADVRAAVRGTVLADAPIVRVSAKTKTGLDALAASLQSLLSEKPSRPDLNRPRLPIDRVFSMPGFGAVVTGTLTDGALALGDEVEILPSEQKGRVRGLQTHKKKEDRAAPGSRTAVNISGIAAEKIQRGEVVVRPNQYQPTRRVDARLRLLKDASAPLKHGAEVKVFLGAAETIAAVRVLGADELAPASEGWAQLELRDPLVAVRGDRLILRRPSPTETIGGGVIADPHPKGRHKRFDEATLNSLESLARGSPADVLLEAALALSPASAKEVMARSGLESEAAASAMNELLANGTLVNLDGGEWRTDSLLMPASRWDALQDKTLQIVGEYHKSFPLRKGIPREELKSKLKLAPRVFNAGLALIANRKLVDENGAFVALPAHAVRLDAAQQVKVKALMRRFEADPSAPPSVKESQAEVGEEVYNALIEMGELTAVSQEVVFRSKDYAAMTEKVKSSIAQNGQTTLAEVRDLLGTTRKYAQALLEHLDAVGVTVRDGDARRLKR